MTPGVKNAPEVCQFAEEADIRRVAYEITSGSNLFFLTGLKESDPVNNIFGGCQDWIQTSQRLSNSMS